jgi:hypothetical protein
MITEVDKLKRAKEYLQKLAEGIDPITDTALPDDTALNNERLSRCFAYVAEVLQKVIDNDGRTSGWQKPFFITADDVKRVTLTDQPVSISIFVKAVNDAVGDTGRKKLTHTTLTKWLVEKGFLRVVQDGDNKTHKELTEKSAGIGLSSEVRNGQSGAYTAILYSMQAQQFLLDHLLSIVS